MPQPPVVLLILLAVTTGCLQIDNSTTKDDARFTPRGAEVSPPAPAAAAPTDGSSAPAPVESTPDRYAAAKVILQTQCISCHSFFHDDWAHYTEADYIRFKYIKPGNWLESDLRNELKQYGGNMPEGSGKQLTSEEIATLEAWVNGLSPN